MVQYNGNMVGATRLMDVRSAGEETQLNELIDRAMSGLCTCLPGIIQSFDASKQTVEVLPAIKMRTFIDNKQEHQDLPLIINVPIVFPNAGGWGVTLPVSAGDECLLIFSQRAIDNWHDLGGTQPPESNAVGARHHDLTDAFAVLAPHSIPNTWTGWNSSGIQIRNKANTTSITITEGRIDIVGDLHVDGNIRYTGNISEE